MKLLKYSILTLAAIIILILMAATVTESFKGTPFVSANIYSAWWFVLLWAILAFLSIIYILKRKLHRRFTVFTIHASFLVILLGALLSWLTAENGTIHLRNGETTHTMTIDGGETSNLNFNITLQNFKIEYYPGTDAPMDYISLLKADEQTIEVEMNKIGEYKGYRFTQASYDDDMGGSTLGVLYDPWGIGITYLGYAMLFISLIISLAGKHTRMTELYRKATSNSRVMKTLVITAVLTSCLFSTRVYAQEKINIDPEIRSNFSRISVLYNSRICPINTVATDFVSKLSGKPSWNGMGANEIFCGWVFDVPYWETAKMIEIKSKQVQDILGIDSKWASFTDFWDEYNDYKLEKPLKEAYKSGDKTRLKALRDADEKFNVIRMLYNGELLKMFPYKKDNGSFQWIAPGQPLGNVKLQDKELTFVRKSMDYLAESIITGDKQRALEIEKKIYSYQHVKAAGIIPSKAHIGCELAYNWLSAQRWTVIMFLSLSLLLAIASSATGEKYSDRIRKYSLILLTVMAVYTTIALALRWIVSGHVPMSNGYETMEFMAWATLLLSFLMRRQLTTVSIFGPLLASFALLVAMITDSNPQITQLMPVLQSPLLSVHVMIIMFSYALFGLMALTGIQGLVCHRHGQAAKTEQLAAMVNLLLYPAVALLAIGIFIGAIWANVSWGKYWSWDAKETWALITLLIYAAPLHSDLKWMKKPNHMLLYVVLAFLTVLMTYFGANYFLAGLHSYA